MQWSSIHHGHETNVIRDHQVGILEEEKIINLDSILTIFIWKWKYIYLALISKSSRLFSLSNVCSVAGLPTCLKQITKYKITGIKLIDVNSYDHFSTWHRNSSDVFALV